MIRTDGRPTIAMRESDPVITRAETKDILEATDDPFLVGVEVMIRVLTEEDFDYLLAHANGWL